MFMTEAMELRKIKEQEMYDDARNDWEIKQIMKIGATARPVSVGVVLNE